MTIGTLTRKTEPHQKCCEQEAADAAGPMATPTPATPAHTPMARPRSVGSGKTLVRIDSVAGMISAPPMPMNARVTISWSAESAERRRAPSRRRR